MRITILCVGKIKESYYSQAILEYARRLSRYCRLEILEVADEKTPDGASFSMEEQIKEKEACRLEKLWKEDSFLIILDRTGTKLDSVSFSQKIEKLGVDGISHLTFVIGGSLGIASSFLKKAQCVISFSDMTFPHQLMRVILLEQIYRGYRIIQNEPYHK